MEEGKQKTKVRVCHNAQIERLTPATDNCNRGDSFKKGVLIHLHSIILGDLELSEVSARVPI